MPEEDGVRNREDISLQRRRNGVGAVKARAPGGGGGPLKVWAPGGGVAERGGWCQRRVIL